AVIVRNKVYVIEYGGSQGIWEITFPMAAPSILITEPAWSPINGFSFTFNTIPGENYHILAATDLGDWSSIASVLATNTSFQFLDPTATNQAPRFYRVSWP